MRLMTISAAGALCCALALVYGSAAAMPWLLAAAALSAATAVVAGFLRRKRLTRAAVALACGVAVVAGSFLLRMNCVERAAATYAGETGEFAFYVTERVQLSSGCRLTVRLLDGDGETMPGVSAWLYGYGWSAEQVEPGDTIRAETRLKRTEQTSAASRGIFLTGTIKQLSGRTARTSWLAALPARIRLHLLERSEAVFQDGAPLMSALLLGDKAGFSDSFTDAVADAGVSHVFAVSGMHLSLLAGAVLFLTRGRRRLSLMAVGAIWLFAAVTGFPASVVRAAVMQTAMLGAPLFGREHDSLTALAAALIVLLAANPFAIADLGLQLSFLSVLGLLTLGTRMHRAMMACVVRLKQDTRLRRARNRMLEWLVGGLSTTVSAQLLTLPLTAWYFGRISLISILSNLLLLWAVELLFLGGWVMLLLALVWLPAGSVAAWPLIWGCRALQSAIRLLADIPFAVIGTDSVWMKAWLALLFAVTAVWLLRRSRRLRMLLAGATAILLALAFGLSKAEEAAAFSVAALSVGHGQCIVVTYGGQTVVVDCGSTRSGAGTTLRNHLQSRNLSKIAVLLLTANASHHANGIPEVLPETKRLVLPEQHGDVEIAAELAERAAETDTAVSWLQEETVWQVGDLTVTAVVPYDARKAHCGAAAVLVNCEHGAVAVLGDVSDRALAQLAEDARFLNAEAVVCARHDAAADGQAEFLLKSRAKYVIISSNGAEQLPQSSETAYEQTSAGTVRLRLN